MGARDRAKIPIHGNPGKIHFDWARLGATGLIRRRQGYRLRQSYDGRVGGQARLIGRSSAYICVHLKELAPTPVRGLAAFIRVRSLAYNWEK